MAANISSGLFCVIVAVSSLTGAAQSPRASGHWEGALQVPGQEVAVEVDLAPADKASDKWEGTISMPRQGMQRFPLSAIAVDGDSVGFEMKGIPGEPHFSGTVSKDGTTLSGDFTQAGAKFAFTLTRKGDAKIERGPGSTPIDKELEGSWEGVLEANGSTLRLIAKLANQQGGAATGTLVSVDQGGAEIPIAAIVQNGAHVKLVVSAVSGTYEGDFKDGVLTGTWTQGPGSWPLVLKRQK